MKGWLEVVASDKATITMRVHPRHPSFIPVIWHGLENRSWPVRVFGTAYIYIKVFVG